jgi:hypothetical protein
MKHLATAAFLVLLSATTAH